MSNENNPIQFVSEQEFLSLNLKEILGDAVHADTHHLRIELQKLAEEVRAKNVSGVSVEACLLLAEICGIHLRVQDPATPFSPFMQFDDRRSCIPSDFRGEQNQILSAIVPQIGNPALRARVADVVWYNERKLKHVAEIAVEAYCETIQKRLDGTYTHRFSCVHVVTPDLVDLIERVFQIISGSGNRKEMLAVMNQTLTALHQRSKTDARFPCFDRLARLGQLSGLLSWQTIAVDTEVVLLNAPSSEYPIAIKGLWELAAKAYEKIGDKEAKRRCRFESVQQTLRMRDEVSQAIAKASWTRDAIGELRAIGGFRNEIEGLREELKNFQDQSLDEFGQFTIPMDLENERHGTIQMFKSLTLPEMFLQFATCISSPDIEELKKSTLQNQRNAFLGIMSGTSHSDRDGKIVAESDAKELTQDSDIELFKEEWLRDLGIRRQYAVSAVIEPARRTIMEHFPVEERVIMPIVHNSPFVPQGHEHIFTLGFSRLFQGDFRSSAFLLIPQLENSIRYVLSNSNHDSSKILPNLLQEDRSLSGLFENCRAQMEEIFGPNLINEIELLFHLKAGPSLRHQMAHGKITTGDCYHPDAIYACWLIYQMTVKPLFPYWKSHVAKDIEMAAF